MHRGRVPAWLRPDLKAKHAVCVFRLWPGNRITLLTDDPYLKVSSGCHHLNPRFDGLDQCGGSPGAQLARAVFAVLDSAVLALPHRRQQQ